MSDVEFPPVIDVSPSAYAEDLDEIIVTLADTAYHRFQYIGPWGEGSYWNDSSILLSCQSVGPQPYTLSLSPGLSSPDGRVFTLTPPSKGWPPGCTITISVGLQVTWWTGASETWTYFTIQFTTRMSTPGITSMSAPYILSEINDYGAIGPDWMSHLSQTTLTLQGRNLGWITSVFLGGAQIPLGPGLDYYTYYQIIDATHLKIGHINRSGNRTYTEGTYPLVLRNAGNVSEDIPIEVVYYDRFITITPNYCPLLLDWFSIVMESSLPGDTAFGSVPDRISMSAYISHIEILARTDTSLTVRILPAIYPRPPAGYVGPIIFMKGSIPNTQYFGLLNALTFVDGPVTTAQCKASKHLVDAKTGLPINL